MATKKKNSRKNPQLAFRDLVHALSYWGTATRVGIIAVIALAVFVMQVAEAQSSLPHMTLLSAILIQAQTFIYVFVSFLILDAGYVTVARTLSFRPIADKAVLFVGEIVLAFGYFLPYFVVVSDSLTILTRYVFVAALLLLAGRVAVGMLYGSKVGR